MPKFTLGKRKMSAAKTTAAARKIQAAWRKRKQDKARAKPPERSLVYPPVAKAAYYTATCTLRAWNMGNLGSDSHISIARFDYAGVFPGVAQIQGIDQSDRFNQLRPLYREFAITGLKVEIIPSKRMTTADVLNTGGGNNQLMNFNVWDTINAEAAWSTPAYGIRFIDDSFKPLDPNKSHVVYRNNRPLAHSMNTPWFDANPSSFTVTTGGPRALTVIGWRMDSPTGTFNAGEIRVTYYVTFRGQRVQ